RANPARSGFVPPQAPASAARNAQLIIATGVCSSTKGIPSGSGYEHTRQIGILLIRKRKIENFISDIQQNGFTDMLAENATLLSETTALRDRIQELEESQETMRARLNELCKVSGVSTVQSDPKRRKRARLL
ncbi:hypothetical protein PENNAL_c0266G02445, partial [Penicillium nalgiovense]